MQKDFLIGILALALLLGLANNVRAITDDFETSTVGTLPPGWVAKITGAGDPKWTVENDDSAPSGHLVLKQSAWTANPSYPLCIKSRVKLTDGFVEAKFKTLSGTNDQAAGLVWRYRDADNYYVVRANALEDNVVLYKMEQGKRKALDIVGRQGGYGTTAKVPPQQWGTLRVEFQGQRSRVLLNGKELFVVEDNTFAGQGAVGLWTKADSVTLFDDFSYGELPTGGDQQAIQKSVLETNAKMTQAANNLNADAMFEYILDNAVIIQNCAVFKSRQDAMQAMKAGFKGIASMDRRFENPQVTVLSPDTALLSSEGTLKATLENGQAIDARFAVSLVFVRKGNDWKLLQGHYSTPARN